MSDRLTALERFGRASELASAQVMRSYSTSFGFSTRLLGRRHRAHIRNVYALVRVADEIVDGVAAQAGLSLNQQEESLERYWAEVRRALELGYSPDLVIHAFAQTARECGIDETLLIPFFASMTTDLHHAVAADGSSLATFDDAAHARYVYGSAEVVGVMCVRVFVRDESREPRELAELEHGARQLGAAFQNVNFLRDYADDTVRLGRSYLSASGTLGDADRDRWITLIRAQLSDASRIIPKLPGDARAAVRAAHDLFAALTDRIAAGMARDDTSNESRARIRVPDARKALIIAGALARTRGGRNS